MITSIVSCKFSTFQTKVFKKKLQIYQEIESEGYAFNFEDELMIFSMVICVRKSDMIKRDLEQETNGVTVTGLGLD